MGTEMGSVARIAPADFLEPLAPRGAARQDEGEGDRGAGGPPEDTVTLQRSGVSSPARPPAVAPLPDVGLVFEISPESGDLVVKVVDRRGGRILRQIPPEEVQRFHSALRTLQGLLVDRKG